MGKAFGIEEKTGNPIDDAEKNSQNPSLSQGI